MGLKCKIASEAACGKDCCCYDCTDAKNCKDKCPTYKKLGKKVLDECEELEKVEEQTEEIYDNHCCKKCANADGYSGYDEHFCKALNRRIRAEIYDCEHFIDDHTEIVTLDQKVPETIKALADLMERKKALEETEATIRQTLLNTMEEWGIKSFENDILKLTYVAASERKSIDTTKLKKEHPEIAEAYQKVSQVKASVKIEVK